MTIFGHRIIFYKGNLNVSCHEALREVGQGTLETHTRKKDHVRSQGEGGHLPAKERGLRRSQTCSQLDLGLLATRTMKKKIPVV